MNIIVVDDPGHGGRDPGAIGNGLQEKAVVLEIVNKVKAWMDALGFRSYRTRSDDTFVELTDRARYAHKVKADYFLSVHVNSGGGTGFESFVQLGTDTGENKRRRSILHKQLSLVFAKHGLRDRGMKEKNLAVLRGSQPVTGCLIELGFIDHPTDADKLKSEAFKSEIVEAIVRGFCEMFNVPFRYPDAKPTPPATLHPSIQKLKDHGLINSDHAAKEQLTWDDFATVVLRLMDRAGIK